MLKLLPPLAPYRSSVRAPERAQHAPQRLPPENVVHDGRGPAPVVLEHADCAGPHEARQEPPLLSLEICAIVENSVNSTLLQ